MGYQISAIILLAVVVKGVTQLWFVDDPVKRDGIYANLGEGAFSTQPHE